MPECAFHPGVETEVSCVDCGRYICPKDMVDAPGGYKCPICAKQKRTEHISIKPKQLAGGIALGVLAGIGGGLLLGFITGMLGWFFFIFMVMWGAGVGEAVRRGSGGHRGPIIATVAGVCVLIGAFAGGLGLFAGIMGVVGVVSAVGWGRGR